MMNKHTLYFVVYKPVISLAFFLARTLLSGRVATSDDVNSSVRALLFILKLS